MGLIKSRITQFLDDQHRVYHPLPEEYRGDIVEYLRRDLGVTEEPVEFYFIEELPPISEVNADYSLLFAGYAREFHEPRKNVRYEVLVFIRPKLKYPVDWKPSASRGGQERDVNLDILSPEELFICLSARELRRVWQYCYRRRGENAGPLACADSDAERYAANILLRYREEKARPRPKMKRLK